MSAPKIKDPAHAVRVLEALDKGIVKKAKVMDHIREQGQIHMGETSRRNLDQCFVLIIGMKEGAKAVLKERSRAYKFRSDVAEIKGWQRGMDLSVIALAQAYAPRMAEAGMEVPE